MMRKGKQTKFRPHLEYPRRLKHASGYWMRHDPTRALVFLKRPLKRATMARRLARVGLVIVQSREPGVEVNHSPWHHWVSDSKGSNIPVDALGALESALEGALAGVSPAYRTPETDGEYELVCPRADRLLVRLRDDLGKNERSRAEHLLAELKLVEVTSCGYLFGYRYFHTTVGATDAYAARATLQRHSRLFSAVWLEHVPFRAPWTRQPSDPLFPVQWGLQRIRAPEAWESTTGSQDVTIVVLDSGCQLDHPDLSFADEGINTGLDLLGWVRPGGPLTGDEDGPNPHGTLMAGVIGARRDNQVGVAGLASDCRLVPVALLATSDAECLHGFAYAVEIGAQVLNFSLGTPEASPVWNLALFSEAIEEAHSRDVLVCASAGNFAQPSVLFPASHPLVMGVAGSNPDDSRWFEPAFRLPSGIIAPTRGSHFGEGVSVGAPGVMIHTTDLTGAEGRSDDDYADSTGTSPAAAFVSALAGLVRSANPFLSNADTRTVIEQTAAKVGPVAYNDAPGFPNGSRNDFFGYGRIDAAQAVDEAVGLYLQHLNHLIHDFV